MSAPASNARARGGPDASPFRLLMDLGQAALQNRDAVGRVVEGISAVADAVREIAVQKTEQQRIQASSAAEIERIHAVRDVMLTYLEKSFDERRRNFDALFTQLDAAMKLGNVDLVAKTLDAVVDLAKSSPFKDLADATKAKAALRDKSTEWEL